MTDAQEPAIESGIPIPATRSVIVNLLRKMKIGDSIFIKDKTVYQVSASWTVTAKRLGMKVSCHTMDGGTRIWRIA